MHAIRRTSKRGGARVYFTCNNWRVNGGCPNSMSAHLPEVDTAVLAALKGAICATHIEDVITRAVELAMEEPDAHEAQRLWLTSEAQRLAEEIERLTEAIATGACSAALGEPWRRASGNAPTCSRGWSIWTAWPRDSPGAMIFAIGCGCTLTSGPGFLRASLSWRVRSCASS